MKEKKEMIEKALGQYCSVIPGIEVIFPNIDLDALAEQAVVIEDIHIEHRDISAPLTIVTCKGRTLKTKAGHHGTPGKALAIIVPLEGDL